LRLIGGQVRTDRREDPDHRDALLNRILNGRHDGVPVVSLDHEGVVLPRDGGVLDLSELVRGIELAVEEGRRRVFGRGGALHALEGRLGEGVGLREAERHADLPLGASGAFLA
jgi:hypothetical protein